MLSARSLPITASVSFCSCPLPYLHDFTAFPRHPQAHSSCASNRMSILQSSGHKMHRSGTRRLVARWLTCATTTAVAFEKDLPWCYREQAVA